MLRDKTGNRLFRRVDIKIVFPDNIFPDKKLSQRAGPHQGFSPDGIDEILMNTADQLDTLYPWWDFKPIELASTGRTASFVFTFVGYRAAITQAPTKEESSTLEPGVTVGTAPAEAGDTPQ